MTIFTTSRKRQVRLFHSFQTSWVLPAALLLCGHSALTAQDCPPDASVSGPGTVLWTAPTDQGAGPWSVQVTARGAGGGDAGNGNFGGQGAEAIATFAINNGEILKAIAGGPGGSGPTEAGGGGGASGVVNCGTSGDCSAGIILLIAAGGNGGEEQGVGAGGNGVNGLPGGGGAGGGNNGGGGGGGILTDGASGTGGGSGTGGTLASPIDLVPGGLGSDSSNDGGEGLGGGGGGGADPNGGSGGGAGRTGGAGGNTSAATCYVRIPATNIQLNSGLPGNGPSSGSVTISCLGTLPIQLIQFKALIQEENVRLIWTTASEKDNHGFDIERSADNKTWSAIGFVPGHGTTTQKSEYQYTDESPLAGVNYYRLRQMDTDGSFQHTPMVVADIRSGALQFDIFPNPSADGALTLRTVSKMEGEALLEIWDWSGLKVWKENHHIWTGTTVWPISLVDYPKGAYSVRLQMPDGTTTFRKVLLQ